MRTPHTILMLTLVAGAGCVAAKDASSVVSFQREAAVALAARSAQDHAALVASSEALLGVRRAALAGRLQARALVLMYEQAEAPMIGGLSGAEAEAWLARYRAGNDGRALVEELPEWETFEQDAAAAMEALAQRGAGTAALFGDLLASSELLGAYTDESGELGGLSPRELLAELYSQELRGRLGDAEKQAAADRIAALLLGEGAEQ